MDEGGGSRGPRLPFTRIPIASAAGALWPLWLVAFGILVLYLAWRAER